MNDILEAIILAGGEPIKIGGCVRDQILGRPNKDIDIEVYGLPVEKLCDVLSKFGKVSIVGESFGVIKLSTGTDEYDFSMPRTDNKIGRGHKEFEVVVDHELTPLEAAKRRDFTINAIGQRLDGSLLDPYHGVQDLSDRILRATSEHFSEDPLRVLRGFQFCARFNLTAEANTLTKCTSLIQEYDTLAKERIWGEWEKWAEKGTSPSKGLKYLYDSGWINLYPELKNLIDVPQDPEWHPEGDAWVHTLHVTDEAVKIADRENLIGEDRITFILAALCHDLGKALPENGGTTSFENGRWRSHGHDEAGVPLSRSFLERIGCLERIIERVLPLVREHMAHTSLDAITPRIVRRASVRLGKATVKELVLLIEADHNGRPPLPGGIPEKAQQIAEIALTLNLEKEKPKGIIGGKHLIKRGMIPGPVFRIILDKCFEAQLDGVFDNEEDGEKYLDTIL